MFIKYQKRLIAINRPKKRAADKWDSPRLISSFLALSFSYSQALSKLRPLAANANRYYYRYLLRILHHADRGYLLCIWNLQSGFWTCDIIPSKLTWQAMFLLAYDFKKPFFSGMAKPTWLIRMPKRTPSLGVTQHTYSHFGLWAIAPQIWISKSLPVVQ